MNLRQLETFRAIMIAGSTQAAARVLNVSQPAVSRMLIHTESALGVSLFERKKGRLVATEEAHLLHREIEPLFLAVEAAQSRIHDIRDGRTGSIRVVATPSLATSVVASGLKSLLRQSPDIRISLDVRRWEMLATQLEANSADIGFVLTTGDRPELKSIPLMTARMVCIMPEDHPLAARRAINPDDLIGQPFITLARSSPLGDLTAHALGQVADRVATVCETRYCNTACSLVQNRIGIALVDQFSVASQVFPGIVTRAFEPEIPVTAFAVLSRNRSASRLTERLIREVRHQLEVQDGPAGPGASRRPRT